MTRPRVDANDEWTIQFSCTDRSAIHTGVARIAIGIARRVVQPVEIAFGVFAGSSFTAGPSFDCVTFVIPGGKTDNYKYNDSYESLCQGSQSHLSPLYGALYFDLCALFFDGPGSPNTKHKALRTKYKALRSH